MKNSKSRLERLALMDEGKLLQNPPRVAPVGETSTAFTVITPKNNYIQLVHISRGILGRFQVVYALAVYAKGSVAAAILQRQVNPI